MCIRRNRAVVVVVVIVIAIRCRRGSRRSAEIDVGQVMIGYERRGMPLALIVRVVVVVARVVVTIGCAYRSSVGRRVWIRGTVVDRRENQRYVFHSNANGSKTLPRIIFGTDYHRFERACERA